MKTKIKNLLTFCSMVIILGIQTLLHGSWKVENPRSGNIEPITDK